MKMHLYTVYDRMSEEYGPIFEQRNHGVARRTFKSMLEKWSGREDEYRLFCLGTKDNETCDMSLFPVREEVPPDGTL